MIDTCIEGGHDVSLLYHSNRSNSDKSYQDIRQEDLAPFAGKVELVQFDLDELRNEAQNFQLDAFVGLDLYHIFTNSNSVDILHILRKQGTLVFSLSYFFESSKFPIAALEAADRTYFLSEFARNLFFELNAPSEKARKSLKEKYLPATEVVGNTMFEQIGDVNADEIRTEFGVPIDKNVVLLMSPVLSQDMVWRWLVWRHPDRRTRIKRVLTGRKQLKGSFFSALWETLTGPSFKDCVEALRAFCDQNNAILIIKSRAKQDDPDYLINAADIYWEGRIEEYHPVFTTYKLLAISDLMVFNQSMSATEAIAAGVPALNIYVPHRDFITNATPIEKRFLDAVSGGQPGTPLNFSGCVTRVDRRKFPQWLSKRSLDDLKLDPTRQKEYLEFLTGENGEPSSQRIQRDMKKMIEDKNL